MHRLGVNSLIEQLPVMTEDELIGVQVAIIYKTNLLQLARLVDLPVKYCTYSMDCHRS